MGFLLYRTNPGLLIVAWPGPDRNPISASKDTTPDTVSSYTSFEVEMELEPE